MIELEGVRREYRLGASTIAALAGVDLVVRPGTFVAVTGPSGSGKSTLLQVLGCLDRPTAGTYRLGGELVSGLGPEALASVRNRRIGFIFQSFHLLPRTTALANVELPLLYSGTGSRERRERARAALERVGLSGRASHRPNELSGGERQRVAIARALVTEPDILLADEPTGNLDSRTGKEIMALLERLNSEGATVLLVTHAPALAARCPRQVRLLDGRVIEDTAPETPPYRAGATPAPAHLGGEPGVTA